MAQLCLTLCDPMDCSPSGSSVHGIIQARILKWLAISLSRGSSRDQTWISLILLANTSYLISIIVSRILIRYILRQKTPQICSISLLVSTAPRSVLDTH